MENWTKFTQGLNTNLAPLAEKMGNNLKELKQMANEKFGSNVSTTELPREYIELDRKLEAVRRAHLALLRHGKNYLGPENPLDMQNLQNQFRGLTTKVGETFSGLTGTSGSATGTPERESPKVDSASLAPKPRNTSYHELSRSFAEVSESLGLEDPLGVGLFKYAGIEQRIGEARLKMENTVMESFMDPLARNLKTSLELALKGKKDVASARLILDASKTTLNSAPPEKADAARQALEAAEDKFVGSVEETMGLMRSVIESPELLKHIIAFVNAQIEFHKEVSGLLSELVPELSEIHLTQEALYRAAEPST